VDSLLAGGDGDVALWLDEPVTRGDLRALVSARAGELASAGLRRGGAISLRLPPSLAYVVNLLAAWRVGAQVSLLDHRLTAHEVDQALSRIAPQLLVSAPDADLAPLRGYTDATAVTTPYAGRPAATGHALLQLSSGSTGPSKVIGRSATDLLTELARYRQIEDTPQPGERVVLLASMVHVLGLVGGLLYALHTGVRLVVPRLVTTGGVLAAVAAGTEPTTVLGVPFHIRLLTAVDRQARLPQLTRMTVGGELVHPAVARAFVDRHQVPLGVMYGMTEVGVIATDLSGEQHPALLPAPGMRLREEHGQVLLATPASPYVGLTDPGRWVERPGEGGGGWLYTRDAGTVDPTTGAVTVLGRLDSQVSVGGLKVDLSEVEQTLTEVPGVAEVVVAHDGAIEAFVALDDPDAEAGLREAMTQRLAPYKRPRRVSVLPKLPRTATGKLVRDLGVLRAARESSHQHVPERSAANVR
jgi:acyl-coenzyme A synthetase/AMP-(fatty) acid ligase